MPATKPIVTPPTYAVLVRVPAAWKAEELVKYEISKALGSTMANVAQRLAYLRELHLVERRVALRAPGFELRRVATDEHD